jgi:aminotransferase EvaB
MRPLFSARLVNQEIQLESTVLRVLNSYRYILGAEVNQFEKEFANYVGVEHCVSLGNGTDALVMSAPSSWRSTRRPSRISGKRRLLR